jgi:hypothetical protein
MKYSFLKNSRYVIIVILLIFMSLYLNPIIINEKAMAETNNKEDVEKAINLIFQNRNTALINGNADLIKSIFDTKTKYGTWAFDYEKEKMQYIHNWQEKQGIKFTNIVPKIVIKRIKEKSSNSYSVNLLCSTEYKYKYDNQPDKENSCRIGTYHVLSIENRSGTWVITKEWYKDPFADSLYLDNTKACSSKEYILSQNAKDNSSIGERRLKAVEYAEQFCGGASDEKYGFKYNNKYRDYNPQGGDCANFASQILFEGGKFKKNGAWNYDQTGATKAWLNADGFKNYMLGSGRASLIAHGSYDQVYKASYKLLPGDFVAYEKKGDITHISTVTSNDSRGYALVTCHNTDRNNVPWDLGWSGKNIKFWLIHVNY